MKFYFTYSKFKGSPFKDGWTEVEAPDGHTAVMAFRAFHPDNEHGIINCAASYSEEAFLKTKMAGPQGNFGERCHEVIKIERILANPII